MLEKKEKGWLNGVFTVSIIAFVPKYISLIWAFDSKDFSEELCVL